MNKFATIASFHGKPLNISTSPPIRLKPNATLRSTSTPGIFRAIRDEFKSRIGQKTKSESIILMSAHPLVSWEADAGLRSYFNASIAGCANFHRRQLLVAAADKVAPRKAPAVDLDKLSAFMTPSSSSGCSAPLYPVRTGRGITRAAQAPDFDPGRGRLGIPGRPLPRGGRRP
jgi:hypothetical protein